MSHRKNDEHTRKLRRWGFRKEETYEEYKNVTMCNYASIKSMLSFTSYACKHLQYASVVAQILSLKITISWTFLQKGLQSSHSRKKKKIITTGLLSLHLQIHLFRNFDLKHLVHGYCSMIKHVTVTGYLGGTFRAMSYHFSHY
jgi:hypothetical protein